MKPTKPSPRQITDSFVEPAYRILVDNLKRIREIAGAAWNDVVDAIGPLILEHAEKKTDNNNRGRDIILAALDISQQVEKAAYSPVVMAVACELIQMMPDDTARHLNPSLN